MSVAQISHIGLHTLESVVLMLMDKALYVGLKHEPQSTVAEGK